MAFDNKQYPNRKDQRRAYTGSKRFDRSCRNNGSCGYCKGNRTHQARKAEEKAKQEMKIHGF